MSLSRYFKGVKGELRHIVWPKYSFIAIETVLVIILSVIVGLYTSVLDMGITSLIKLIIA
jgi:preprotein translocase subunit SecE